VGKISPWERMLKLVLLLFFFFPAVAAWCALDLTAWEKSPSSGRDSVFLAGQSPLSLPGPLAQDLIKRLL